MTREMTFDIEDITPQDAKRYLERNVKCNRPISRSNVETLKKAIADDKFVTTHEGLCFSRDDEVLDGQHRLTAIAEGDKTVQMLVIRNCDPDTFSVIGCGRPRSASDVFAITYQRQHDDRATYAQNVTSVANAMLRGMLDTSNFRPDREAVARHALRHYKLILKIVTKTNKYRFALGMPVLAALANASIYYGQAKIDPFIDRLASQMWTSERDPAKALYDRLLRDRQGGRHQGIRHSPTTRYALAVGAIRNFLLGREVVRLEATVSDFGSVDIDKRLRRGLTDGEVVGETR